MTTVTITLTDHESGHVTVNIDGLAPIGKNPTKAQAFGNALNDAINDLRPCVSGMGFNFCSYCDDTCTKRNGR